MTTTPSPSPLSDLPADYAEKVYAGVLGKVIGVYLGRPIEGWDNDAIEQSFGGEIDSYLHEKVSEIHKRRGRDIDLPLIVTDDDISGTFTFVRALEDNGYDPDLTARAIGRSWLNYLIEDRTVLWWGGMGESTEHTAYLRLKHGVDAPESGSMARNGQVVAEQIGAQIFIDGWAVLHPGDPERAADLARRAASVSHDGVAVHGAQVIAAMEAQAFDEAPTAAGVDRCIDAAAAQIPADSLINEVLRDVRDWHAATPDDWRATFERIKRRYGYDTYGGNCHMVPNHALIVMALLHSGGDFTRGQIIVNTAGWDTDCNAGNLGCLMGILGGIEGIEGGPDWRGPVADRLYVPTADGGRSISDAAREADHLVVAAHRMRGRDHQTPKNGSRFHFAYPGSVQGFTSDDLTVANEANGAGSHWLTLDGPTGSGSAFTPTFVESKETAKLWEQVGYALLASPSLGAAQVVTARVANLGPADVEVALAVKAYTESDELETITGPATTLTPAADEELAWTVPDTNGRPVAFVGLVIDTATGPGRVALDRLGWAGVPTVSLGRHSGGQMWRRAWVNGVDELSRLGEESFRIVHNEGTGLLLHGCREWTDYEVTADVRPHLALSAGIGARVQGMRRHYALVLVPGSGIEIRATVDDGPEVLAAADAPVALGATWQLTLRVEGPAITGRAERNDGTVIDLEATDDRLQGGGIALICEEGRAETDRVDLRPVPPTPTRS